MRILSFFIGLAVIIVFSCTPTHDNQPPLRTCVLDSIWLTTDGARLQYTNGLFTGFLTPGGFELSVDYDAQKRPVSSEFGDTNDWIWRKQWTYNAQGSVSELQIQYNSGGGNGEKSRFEIDYVNGKRSVSRAYFFQTGSGQYEYDGKMVYNWTGENLGSTDHYDADNNPKYTTTYTYDLSKINSFLIAPEFSFVLLGEPSGENLQDALYLSRNIMTKAEESGGDERKYQYTYTFNGDGLIFKIISKDLTSGQTEDNQEFFYKCN